MKSRLLCFSLLLATPALGACNPLDLACPEGYWRPMAGEDCVPVPQIEDAGTDAGPMDAGTDAGPMDAGASDASAGDASTDGAAGDASTDGAVGDASVTDGGPSDASTDAG